MFMMVESLLMCTDTSYELRGCETTFSNITSEVLLSVEHHIRTGPSSISKLKQFQPK